jgi:hypothetical protein
MGNSSLSIWHLVIFFVLILGVFLICREIVCWYWKVNQTVALLTEIRDHLANASSARATPAPIEQSTSGEASLSAAKNLAASGHNATEISKELQKWRGLSPEESDELARRALGRT